MRNSLLLSIIGLLLASQPSFAERSKGRVKAKSKAPSAKLSTDIRFSGSDVLGKYQVPGEAIATVEKEKPLIELIEPRREFKDRMRAAVTKK